MSSRIPAKPDNLRGAVWMLASAFTFTAMTSLVKFLGDYPAPLQTFYRQTAALVVLTPWILRYGRQAFATPSLPRMVVRSGLSVFAMALSFYAYQHLPLAMANTLSFTRGLWTAPLAVLLLKERLGLARIAAILVGFSGVLLMVGPGEGDVALWPLAAGLLSSMVFAFNIVSVKIMTRDNAMLPLMAWAAVLGAGFSLPPALAVWAWPTPIDFALLAAMGVTGMLNQLFVLRAMQVGEVTVMAPVEYTRILFAVLIGMLLFAEQPSLAAYGGMALIVAAGLFITLRERLSRRPRAAVD